MKLAIQISVHGFNQQYCASDCFYRDNGFCKLFGDSLYRYGDFFYRLGECESATYGRGRELEVKP